METSFFMKMPMTEKQLLARDAKRDISAELLLSVRQMKAGKDKVVASVRHQLKDLETSVLHGRPY